MKSKMRFHAAPRTFEGLPGSRERIWAQYRAFYPLVRVRELKGGSVGSIWRVHDPLAVRATPHDYA